MTFVEFELKLDKEFGEYYFQPFGKNEDYEWIDQCPKDEKGNLICFAEKGIITIVKVDYDKMKVICKKEYEIY